MVMTRHCAINIEAIEKATLDYGQGEHLRTIGAIVTSRVALTVYF
jgi:hypothetical protein